MRRRREERARRRRRVSLVISQTQYEQLEKLATIWDRPVSDVAAFLLSPILARLSVSVGVDTETDNPPYEDSNYRK